MEQTLLTKFNGDINPASVKQENVEVSDTQSYFLHNAKRWLNKAEKDYEVYLGPKATWSVEIKKYFAEIKRVILSELNKINHSVIFEPCRPEIERRADGEPTRYPNDVVRWLSASRESYLRWFSETHVCDELINRCFSYINSMVVSSLNNVEQEDYWWGKD